MSGNRFSEKLKSFTYLPSKSSSIFKSNDAIFSDLTEMDVVNKDEKNIFTLSKTTKLLHQTFN